MEVCHSIVTYVPLFMRTRIALWKSTKEGAEIVKAATFKGTPTGSGIKQ